MYMYMYKYKTIDSILHGSNHKPMSIDGGHSMGWGFSLQPWDPRQWAPRCFKAPSSMNIPSRCY